MCGSICLLMFVAYQHIPWPLVPSSLGHPATVPSLGSLRGPWAPWGSWCEPPRCPCVQTCQRPSPPEGLQRCRWTCCGEFVQLWYGLWSCMIYIYIISIYYTWYYMSWYDIYTYIHTMCIYIYEIIYELFFVIWEYLNSDGDWGYEETQHLLANWPGRHQWAVVQKNHPSGLGRPLFAHSFTGGLLWG